MISHFQQTNIFFTFAIAILIAVLFMMNPTFVIASCSGLSGTDWQQCDEAEARQKKQLMEILSRGSESKEETKTTKNKGRKTLKNKKSGNKHTKTDTKK